MKLVIQVVKEANVKVDNDPVAEIYRGMLVFVCFEKESDKEYLKYFTERLPELKIFPISEEGEIKIKASLRQIDGEILVVPEFTLSASFDEVKPTFHKALPFKQAKIYYDEFIKELKKVYPKVKIGIFGAIMEISLINDGPITFILEK